MRAVVQRVSESSCTVEGEVTGAIGPGLMVLIGVAEGDSEADGKWIAEKVAGLRIFNDAEGKFNLSLTEVDGAILAISQFTLLGDCRKGRRPSFARAAEPTRANELYEHVIAQWRGMGIQVEVGRFGAHMDIQLVNDGPVTLLVDSARDF